MTPAMQRKFKSLATDRGFWRDESTATHQDLAGIFVARAVERYLKLDGTLAFVVPNSVLDRDYWTGFRRGQFDGANVAFTPSWDLRRIRPHLFPRGSGVIFGARALTAKQLPRETLIWTGRAPHRHSHVDTAVLLHQHIGELVVASEDDQTSPYAKRFSQGANLVPRLLFRVQPAPATGLGVPAGLLRVQSKRSATEKRPWKDLTALTGAVETEFVWPTLLGEQVVPFHIREPESFVIPLTQKGDLLSGDDTKIDAYPGLAAWTREAETVWQDHRQSRMSLTDQINHMSKLTNQVPVTQPRVVYAKAGMHLAAAVVTDHRPVIDHKLYWAAMGSETEAHFVAGILNAPVTTELARPLMSYGKDERDIDKSVWKLPIPVFDADDEIHTHIAALARELGAAISELEFPSDNFVTIRRSVRAYIATSPTGQKLDRLVAELLGAPLTDDQESAVADLDLPAAAADHSDVRLIRLTNTPAPKPADVEIDFDCEYDDTARVYLWGALRSTTSGPATYTSFGDPSPTIGEHQLAEQFLNWCRQQISQAEETNADIRFFHYGPTDTQHLTRILGAAADPILSRSVNYLNDVIRPNFYAPHGYGLKQIAAATDAHWRTPIVTGADTIAWIHAARTGDPTAWDTLVAYNEDDTRALHAVRALVRDTDTVGDTRPTSRAPENQT